MKRAIWRFFCLLIAVHLGLTACSAEATPIATSILATETPIPPTFTPTITPEPTETSIPPTPTVGVGSTVISDKDGMTLLYVPAGEFTMGSDTYNDEKPIHTVTLDAFWIDQTEVTNKMYAACVEAGACEEPTNTSSYTHSSYFGIAEFDNYPVIYVDWTRAKSYCEWVDRRLPTEAEWEKTARGENASVYPWGDTIEGNLVNFCDTNCALYWKNNSFDDGYADVAPVGSYPAGQSIYGALDMAGNVLEWVNTWYDVYPGGEPMASSDFGQKYRVLRGGSWDGIDLSVRSALRHRSVPTATLYSIGFRCVMSATQ